MKAVQRPAQVYRGARKRTVAAQRLELTPVTPDRPPCPACGGGVRIVLAIYSDVAHGIVSGKTRVFGAHSFGGKRGKDATTAPCPGAQTVYIGEDS